MKGDTEIDFADSLTIPLFRGDEAHYPNWLRIFTSACYLHDCAEALQPSHADVMPPLADSAVLTEAETKAVTKNAIAMHLLNTALEGDVMGMFIIDSYTPEYPLGVAWKVMIALSKRFNPDSKLDKMVNFIKEIDAITMKRREDPGNLIDKLEGISARYTISGVAVPKEALIARALVAAHDDYKDVLVAAKLAKGDDLTLEEIRSYMVTLYEAMHGHAAPKAADMSTRSRNRLPRRRYACGYCSKKGHDESTCWFKPGNKVPVHAISLLQKELARLRSASVQSGVRSAKGAHVVDSC
jgi:hypothetical protein